MALMAGGPNDEIRPSPIVPMAQMDSPRIYDRWPRDPRAGRAGGQERLGSHSPALARQRRQVLEQELSKIEKPAGIANPKDFRFEVVKFSLRARSKNGGKNPNWTSYEKIREVIERRMFSQVEDLLPVISFGKKQDNETERKHEEFVQRMVERGYTARQVRRLVEWYMRVKKSS